MSRTGLYSLLAAACLLGIAYVGFSYYFESFFGQVGWKACFVKSLTGYPCPSCGTTRSVKLLFNGHVGSALLMNPLGLVVGLTMVALPVLLAYDLVLRKQILYKAYQAFETTLARNKWLALILAILILLNWIWNINKNL